MNAEVLSIGTELLLGQIVDTNAAYLAGRLAMHGIDCRHMQTVGDNLERAVAALSKRIANHSPAQFGEPLRPLGDVLHVGGRWKAVYHRP